MNWEEVFTEKMAKRLEAAIKQVALDSAVAAWREVREARRRYPEEPTIGLIYDRIRSDALNSLLALLEVAVEGARELAALERRKTALVGPIR